MFICQEENRHGATGQEARYMGTMKCIRGLLLAMASSGAAKRNARGRICYRGLDGPFLVTACPKAPRRTVRRSVLWWCQSGPQHAFWLACSFFSGISSRPRHEDPSGAGRWSRQTCSQGYVCAEPRVGIQYMEARRLWLLWDHFLSSACRVL